MYFWYSIFGVTKSNFMLVTNNKYWNIIEQVIYLYYCFWTLFILQIMLIFAITPMFIIPNSGTYSNLRFQT